jgi:anti-anti-sigma factor
VINFRLENKDGKVVVHLEGDLDIEATEILEGSFLETVLETEGSIELNFEKINFVDSSGIGLLINLINKLKEGRRRPTIINLNEDVRIVFDLLQMDEILGKEVLV